MFLACQSATRFLSTLKVKLAEFMTLASAWFEPGIPKWGMIELGKRREGAQKISGPENSFPCSKAPAGNEPEQIRTQCIGVLH